MIVGGAGAGKTTLALQLAQRTHLPVHHMDLIHYGPDWTERSKDEKDCLTRQVHAEDAWIFEGGHSRTYDERARRADTLIWLDLPVGLRLWRVLRRWWTWRGRTRVEMPPGCTERLDPAFIRWIVGTRRRARRKVRYLVEAHPHLRVHHLRSRRDVRWLLDTVAR